MLAETVIAVPHFGKLASGVGLHRRDHFGTHHLPSQDVSSQNGTLGWMNHKGDGGESNESDSDDDQQSDILIISEESESEWSSYQALEDVKEKHHEEEGDETKILPTVVPEHSSPSPSGEDGHGSRGKNLQTNLSWGKKSQQKMNHGKQWIVTHLVYVSTAVSMVSLEDIQKAYHNDCQKKGQEPLTMFVLARLIHQEFPEAGKCRRGPRGSQKIHYRKLQWSTDCSPKHEPMKSSTSKVLENKAAEEVPSEGLLSEVKREDEKPPLLTVNSRDVLQDSKSGKCDETPRAVKEARKAIQQAALHPLPKDEDEDQDGCHDAAERFSQVVKSIKMQGKFDVLLKVFAHSASCNSPSCQPLGLMFRRVRRHVVNARHPCYVMRIYSLLLKLHVAQCNSNACGMTACPALRASRKMKRGNDQELQDEAGQLKQQQGDEVQHLNKKMCLQAKRPSNLCIRMPSPASSLPDSEPSTPSPNVSPTHILPLSPVRNASYSRIVPLMPLERNHVAKISTESRCA